MTASQLRQALSAYRERLDALVRLLVELDRCGLTIYPPARLLAALQTVDLHLTSLHRRRATEAEVIAIRRSLESKLLCPMRHDLTQARGAISEAMAAVATRYRTLQRLLDSAGTASDLGFELPTSTDFDSRIAWAGERYADLAESVLTVEQGDAVYQIVYGWSDLASENERERYRRVAGQIAQLVRSRRELEQ